MGNYRGDFGPGNLGHPRAATSSSARRSAATGPARTEARRDSRRSGASRRPSDAQLVAHLVVTAVRTVLHTAFRVLGALARGLVAFLRWLVPFCRDHAKATLTVLAAAAIAVAVAQVRGCTAREQAEKDSAAALASAQQTAQALTAGVVDDAKTLVEPASTPADQWALGQMPYLYQTDPQWSYDTYSGGRLRHYGCGPTALDMVYIALTGKTDLDPAGMASFAEKNGYAADAQGTSWSLMTQGAAQLGLTGKQVSTSVATVKAELQSGRPVICVMNPGTFTSVGHFIVLEKLDESGQVVVHDSNSWVRSQKSWDLSLVCGEAGAAWSFTVAK